MSDDLTRRSERDRLKLEQKASLRAAVFHADVDLQELADAAGVSPTMPSRWASRKCADVMTIVDLVLAGRLSKPLAHDLLRFVGDALGFVIAPRLASDGRIEHLRVAGKLARESAEVVDAVIAAHDDGAVSDDELARLVVELRDLEEVTAGLRAWVDEERERRGLTRPVPILRAVGDE